MRHFAKISPTFWTGRTGRRINSLDPSIRHSARVLATYLFTSPHSAAAGLYQIPLSIAAIHTGMAQDEIREAMTQLQNAEIDFAAYDEASEFVWVKEMAEFQLNLPLQFEDNRRAWLTNWWQSLEENPFLVPFFERYRFDLHLPKREGASKGLRRVSGGTRSPSPSLSLVSNISHSPNPSKTPSQFQNLGKGARGETQTQELAEIWAKVLKAAEGIFSTDHMRHIRANWLVRIDKKGIYVLACPSKAHADMMNENAALLRSAARSAGVMVSRWCFVPMKKQEEVIVR